MAPNRRRKECDVQQVWSSQRGKLIRVDDDLRCGSRLVASLLDFLKHKFNEEFDDFVDGYNVSGVDVFSDILQSSSSASRKEEKVTENETDDSCNKTTRPSSVIKVVPKEPPASSSCFVRLPSVGVENTENVQSAKAVRNSKQRSNVSLNVKNGITVAPQTATISQASVNLRKPSERKSKGTNVERPSPSVQSASVTRLQKKNQLKNDWEIETSNRLRSWELKVPLKKLPSKQHKLPPKRRDSNRRRILSHNFRQVRGRENNYADSFVPGGSSVDSGPSQDPLKSGSETVRKSSAVLTQKTRLRTTGIQQTLKNSSRCSNLKCSTCKKSYSSLGNLSMHKRTHEVEKKFNCVLCPRSFHQNNSLQMHMNTHTKETPFKCSWCPKYFRYPSNRRIHETIHTDLKPLKCPFCSECFRYWSTFRRHKISHQNEKHYRCFVCPKVFRTSSQVNRHERIHRFE